LDNLRDVAGACLDKCQELRVFNTICDATSVRQEEARELARNSDLVLVIGGFNSANTTRLAQICREIQPRVHHVETADQLEPQWFEGIETVGVTAGASTPGWLIDEVIRKVEGMSRKS
jgi:4-hydroxy-3-methylbut-2-enyl diphosphate reductase